MVAASKASMTRQPCSSHPVTATGRRASKRASEKASWRISKKVGFLMAEGTLCRGFSGVMNFQQCTQPIALFLFLSVCGFPKAFHLEEPFEGYKLWSFV